MRRRASILVATAALLALGAFAAGCSSSSDDEGASLAPVVDTVEGVSQADRIDRLAELARAEDSTVSLYTSMSSELADEIVAGFEDTFDIDVAVYRARDEALLTRLLEEHAAGFRGADVVHTNGLTLDRLGREGALSSYPYDPEPMLDDSTHDAWATASLQRFTVNWNTESAIPPPTTWEELADPRYRGRIAVEGGDYDWYHALLTHWVEVEGKTEAEARRLFEGIVRNGTIVRGHSLMAQLLAAGEFDVALPNYAHVVERVKREGGPIDWEPAVEPTFLGPDGVALSEAPPHPATAALFVEWLLSPDGQKALTDEGYVSARKDTGTDLDVEGELIDIAALAADEERWQQEWDEIAALGTERPG